MSEVLILGPSVATWPTVANNALQRWLEQKNKIEWEYNGMVVVADCSQAQILPKISLKNRPTGQQSLATDSSEDIAPGGLRRTTGRVSTEMQDARMVNKSWTVARGTFFSWTHLGLEPGIEVTNRAIGRSNNVGRVVIGIAILDKGLALVEWTFILVSGSWMNGTQGLSSLLASGSATSKAWVGEHGVRYDSDSLPRPMDTRKRNQALACCCCCCACLMVIFRWAKIAFASISTGRTSRKLKLGIYGHCTTIQYLQDPPAHTLDALILPLYRPPEPVSCA
ncbi:hypothetical protein BDW22DRAFT_1347867 [Trametopsis cervina]|nr:hypothetical protein BDW22DRAFT_1347867 [Trametopsis cervina]